MMRERMSRPSSSVPNQCACDGVLRRAGKLMAAGSCGAIHGANRAKIKKTITRTSPVAASGLWRAVRRNEMAVVDMIRSHAWIYTGHLRCYGWLAQRYARKSDRTG